MRKNEFLRVSRSEGVPVRWSLMCALVIPACASLALARGLPGLSPVPLRPAAIEIFSFRTTTRSLDSKHSCTSFHSSSACRSPSPVFLLTPTSEYPEVEWGLMHLFLSRTMHSLPRFDLSFFGVSEHRRPGTTFDVESQGHVRGGVWPCCSCVKVDSGLWGEGHRGRRIPGWPRTRRRRC